MLINFERKGGDPVAINPDLVRFVQPDKVEDAAALIVFGKDHWVSVVGSVEQVARRISGAMEGNSR